MQFFKVFDGAVLFMHVSCFFCRHRDFIQSLYLYFGSGFEYCPYETIQIIHNNAHHWILLSLFNGEDKIFDSLNTDPTIETLQQIKQLFSPDNTFPLHLLSPCHKQVGTTYCGVLAYSIDILFGNNPSKIVYDQSQPVIITIIYLLHKITIALKFMFYISSDLPIPAKKLQTPG